MQKRQVLIWVAISGAALVCLYGARSFLREDTVLKPVDELRIRFTSVVQVPDPARIANTGDWYYLDHVSSGLSHYDSVKKEFQPLLAESWVNEPGGAHRFRIRPNARFHDGTPITAKDVLWTIKRQLILKTSTHFPLWEYVLGCEKLHVLTDECPGLEAISDREIVIRLKAPTESFFLQLASPETGIWAASDMDPKTASLKPTKFSGPYFVATIGEDSALLRRNPYSPISEQFPNSPRTIRIKKMPPTQVDEALVRRDLDLIIRLHSGKSTLDLAKSGIQAHSSTKSGIVHFFGLGNGDRVPVGRDFIQALWRVNQDPVLTEASSFLPFSKEYSLSTPELLNELPEHTAKRLRLHGIEGFFTKDLVDQIERAAASIGTKVEITTGPFSEWIGAIEDPKAIEKYDYLLAIYAASERYPAVQLRYLTGPFGVPPYDLKQAESPDLKPAQIELLRNYQKWLLRSRQAIPFYFTATEILYQGNLDIGIQPSSDAEVELWRVQQRAK